MKMRKRKRKKISVNKSEDDSKVNKIKYEVKIFFDSMHDPETAEANFCQCSIGKRS